MIQSHGVANPCDAGALAVGARCIIEVDSVNSPTGVWWGEVVNVIDKASYLSVNSKIVGGRFVFDDRCVPIRSDENSGQTPHLNYCVYPDNETTRRLFGRLAIANGKIAEGWHSARQWRETHFETMKALARVGLAPKEVL